MSASPRLAWELIERIISESEDDTETIYSLSLTCRQLRPRSLCHMVADVDIRTRKQVTAFRDFLEAYPQFCHFVCSIRADPTTFMPFPLLNILPNVISIEWSASMREYHRVGLSLPLRVLTCYHKFGTNVTSLSLYSLSFKTWQELCRVLLAFTAVKELRCEGLEVESRAINGAALEQRLRSQGLKLRTINIAYGVPEAVTKLLFELAQSTVERLALHVYNITSLSSDLLCEKWPELLTLTLNLTVFPRSNGDDNGIAASIIILKGFRPPRLDEVTVEIQSTVGNLLLWIGSDERNLHLCSELDQTLLSYRHPQLLPFGHRRTRSWRKGLWSEELGQYFPRLRERGSLQFASSADIALGHDELVTSLVYCPDGSRLATASMDCTIILWNSDGQLVHEWVAHTRAVYSLAFSPDSRHLASGYADGKIAVWDVSQGAQKIATLEGHTKLVNHCAWSPDGTLIASASRDKTVRLWDTPTFQQLHLLKVSTNDFVPVVYFSSNGRWLVSPSSRRCYVWDIASGAMYKDFCIAEGDDNGDQAVINEENEEDEDVGTWCCATALNLQGTRFATGYPGGSVRIWDAQTGQCLVVSRMHMDRVFRVAFSLDGARLLSTAWDGTAKIWDASSGAMILSLEGHTEGIRAACFSPCGKYIASASFDKTERLWRTEDGSCMGTFSEHKAWVMHIAFSTDGKTLSSGAHDGTVVIRHMGLL
ncbi:quinon protein alcohol dehydrogenase-like superfamily [Dichomitus squalens]|uniref:Quinon protein alcohol dehydrogenase-like superfamily n=1 Tax=Dichomitus squalens TaxID=114155 RepID=A0A4Q9MGJ2_9APHY|nr:quinon protein alcohol dehydrogenase-like superfamily [Dichomitus squalens]